MSVYLHSILSVGPFVYRLGRKIFILERGVRLSYGLLDLSKIIDINVDDLTFLYPLEPF